jgi:hypothetical protein
VLKLDEEDVQLRKSVCEKLATFALRDQNKDMLRVIMLVHDGIYEGDFPGMFDDMKHDGGDPGIIRIVEEMRYESPVSLEGKRYYQRHLLDIFA